MRKVRKLPPGHSIIWQDGNFGLPARLLADAAAAAPAPSKSDAELAAELWSDLGRAVEAQLVSDVPVGIFLSGGIDSSCVATRGRRGRRAHEGVLDRVRGRRPSTSPRTRAWWPSASTSSGSRETLHERNLLDVIDAALDHIDEPLADPSFLPTFLLSRLAARHVKVVVGGDGGDELWGGYPTYRAHRLRRRLGRVPGLIRKHVVGRAVGRLPIDDRYQSLEWKLRRFTKRWDDDMVTRHLRWMSSVDLPDLARAIPAREGDAAGDAVGARCPRPTIALQRILALDFSTYMPGSVLTKVDRASMAHGLEVRPPLLDDALVERAFALPSSYKLRKGVGQVPAQARGARQDPRRDHRPPQEGVRHPAGGLAARPAPGADRRGRRPVAGFGSRHPGRRRLPRAGTASIRTKRADSQQAALGATRAGPLAPAASGPYPCAVAHDDERTSQGSPDRFGYEWSTYSGILPESSGQLERWLGSTALASFRGKRVMDVGCGMGRNPYWYVEAGAHSVLGVDMDDGSLAAARQNLAPFANARVEKARPTSWIPPCTAHSIASPASACCTTSPIPRTRCGGCGAASPRAAIWCCGATRRKGNRLMLPVIQSFRAIGSRLPIGVTHAVAKGITALAWPAIQILPVPDRLLPAAAHAVVQERRVDHLRSDVAPHRALLDPRGHGPPGRRLLDGGRPRIEFVQGNSWHANIAKP